MAVTTDLRNSSDNLPATPMKQAFSTKKRVSFATNNGDDGDKFTTHTIKKGQLIAVVVDLKTAEGGAATIEMKTTESSAQTILSAASINGTGVLIGDGADGDAALKWFYVTEDATIQIETNTDSTGTAVLDVDLFTIDAAIDLNA